MHAAAVTIFLVLSLALEGPVNLLDRQESPVERQDGPHQTEIQTSSQDGSKLTDGTPVRLRFVRKVASTQVLAGDEVPLEVVDRVTVGNLVVVLPGASADAIVTVAEPRRSMGRGGNVEVKLESVRLTDGEIVPLRAVKGVDLNGGQTQQAVLSTLGTAAVMYWATSPLTLLFYVRGKAATIPAGTEITAYVAGDFPIDLSKFRAIDPNPQEKRASR